MELTFLGRGSAFNYKEGNTSAYFIENNELFLIDCGESVFKALMENEILKGITKINIMITHTHSDHVGSLGTLLTYTYFTLKQRVNIIVRDDGQNIPSLEMILKGFGCPTDSYSYTSEQNYDNRYKSFSKIRFIRAIHSEGLDCNSLIFHTSSKIVYYSGDSKYEDTIKSLIQDETSACKLYIDVTNDITSANVHLHIDRLNNIVPPAVRKKIYCMHFNNESCLKQAYDYGFNVVEVLKSKQEVYTKTKKD